MWRLRLRTQLLISTLAIICGLTGTILLIVRHTVRTEIDKQVQESTAASVRAFEGVQQERQLQLSRTAAMLAELPTLKALMTTLHAPTIQDGSAGFWKLAGSDLFVLADPAGKVLGLHVSRAALDAAKAERHLANSLAEGQDAAWWYSDGRLYWVFLRMITAGAGKDAKQLGVVAIGYEVDSGVAEELALVAGSKIALAADNKIIASTLPAADERELQHRFIRDSYLGSGTHELRLGGAGYQVASVALHNGPPLPVRCYVMVPLERPMNFIRRLNRTILVVGISAVLFASLLLSSVSGTITRPMDNLVAGVRALAVGDYNYSINPRGSTEVAELAEAFSKMRGELLASQRQRIATERVAALGRAASSISHDLRHSLAAVVANAEFLYEADRLKLDKDEIYDEIKTASDQMTELLDSLRELAREQRSVSPLPGSMDRTIHRAIQAVLAQPDLRNRAISLHATGDMNGVFDPRKIERVFFNLVMNASEATDDHDGKIDVDIRSGKDLFEIRLQDNGCGIPAGIRNTLFDPFVSLGKANGTGLGLAIVSKIIQDHYGSIEVERTSDAGTVFLIKLPRFQQESAERAQQMLA